MAPHSSILAWKIPWTLEPGRLQCPWDRKESDMTEHAHTHTHAHTHSVYMSVPSHSNFSTCVAEASTSYPLNSFDICTDE